MRIAVSEAPLLQIRGLSVGYPTRSRPDRGGARRGSDVAAGECLGIVGESGSGKTQLLLAILGLAAPDAQLRGSIRYRGEELLRHECQSAESRCAASASAWCSRIR